MHKPWLTVHRSCWRTVSIWAVIAFLFPANALFAQLSLPKGEMALPPSDSPTVASYATTMDPMALARRYRTRPEPKGEWKSLTIPIKRVGNLLLIEAKAGDLQGNFILDFGAPYLVLNRTYFRNYERVYGATASDLSGQAAAVYQTQLPRLDIRDLYYENIDADVADLGEIENRRGVQILGLLGVELFLRLGVTVDVVRDVLYLHRLDENGERLETNELDAREPAFKVPVTLMDNTVVLDVTIATKPLQFALDSGAEVNVLDYTLNRKVLEALTVERRVMVHGAAGGSAEVLAGTLSEYSVGGRTFKGGKTIVANLDAMGKSSAAGGLDGMLGYSFFDQGIVRLNFVRKELWWYPFVETGTR